jgi:hypothetical protein
MTPGAATATLVRSLEQARREVERRRDAVLNEMNREIRALDRAVRILRGERPLADKSDPVKIAGRKNVEAVREYLCQREAASQAAIGKALDLNSGTLSWVMKALQEEGSVKPTGREGRSRVWSYIGLPVVLKGGGAEGSATGSGERDSRPSAQGVSRPGRRRAS